jgi:metal-responsive CopG/Arc/MetJ family transcriptional regulator
MAAASYTIVGMEATTDTQNRRPAAVAIAISFRQDQRDWLDAEAERQMHGNRSRIVQDALDLYRETMETRQRIGVQSR